MSVSSDPRWSPTTDVRSKYYYRRPLTARELLPAIGVGVGAGVVAFYLARLFLQRTSLTPSSGSNGARSALRRAESAPIVDSVRR
jgi:hypothetical protein